MSNINFDPLWYYEACKDAVKRPKQEVSDGAFTVIVVCAIISLILFGGLAVLFIWYFTS